jgi:hypothetical protein
MINNDNDPLDQKKEEPAEQVATPDEHPGIAVQGFLKIFDPESGEILAQGRA